MTTLFPEDIHKPSMKEREVFLERYKGYSPYDLNHYFMKQMINWDFFTHEDSKTFKESHCWVCSTILNMPNI